MEQHEDSHEESSDPDGDSSRDKNEAEAHEEDDDSFYQQITLQNKQIKSSKPKQQSTGDVHLNAQLKTKPN